MSDSRWSRGQMLNMPRAGDCQVESVSKFSDGRVELLLVSSKVFGLAFQYNVWIAVMCDHCGSVISIAPEHVVQARRDSAATLGGDE